MCSGDPTAEDIAAFAEFVEAFGSTSFVSGDWLTPSQCDGADFAFPIWAPDEVVSEWHQALYDRNIVDPRSAYLSDEFAQEMERFEADPSLLSAADLPTIRTVLTNISRGDRFCEGYMASMFENGVAQAATKRLVSLASLHGRGS